MAGDVLAQLQKLLLKNKKLYAMLNNRVANNEQLRGGRQSSGSLQPATADSKLMDFEIEQQLQAHGFDFTNPMVFGGSPETESLNSDQIGRSPQEHSSQTLTHPQVDLARGGPPQSSPSSSQQISGTHAHWDQSHSAGGDLPSHYGQNFTDMDFDLDTFPAGNINSLATFQAFGWSDYGMPDHSSAPNEISGSMQENFCSSEKHT